MRILVAGGDRVDAGKTTFTKGLVSRTGAVGFKPRAGNDVWFHHDDVRRAIEEGRLYGGDAEALAEASPGQLEPEAINPVHRLWRPSPGAGTGLLGREDREFVLDRAGDAYVRNATVAVPAEIREAFPVESAEAVDSLAALNDAMDRLHLPALEAVGERIGDVDRAVIESYGDVARPLRGIEPDAVAVVEPGRVRLFEGERYRRACEVATGGHDTGQLEERVPSVLELIEPAEKHPLPPLTSAERSEPSAVADAYGDVYDDLLALWA